MFSFRYSIILPLFGGKDITDSIPNCCFKGVSLNCFLKSDTELNAKPAEAFPKLKSSCFVNMKVPVFCDLQAGPSQKSVHVCTQTHCPTAVASMTYPRPILLDPTCFNDGILNQRALRNTKVLGLHVRVLLVTNYSGSQKERRSPGGLRTDPQI